MLGAVVAYHSSDQASREQVRRLLPTITDNSRIGVRHARILAVTDPFSHRAALLGELPRLVEAAQGRPEKLISVATVAWLLDETPWAVRLFDDGRARWRARGQVPDGLVCAAWTAYFERGRWATADAMVDQGTRRDSRHGTARRHRVRIRDARIGVCCPRRDRHRT